jgi:hypothetical protein
MNSFKWIIPTVFLCFGGLNIPSQTSSSGVNLAKTDEMQTSVQIVFKTNVVCTIDQVKLRALNAIKARGWTPTDHGECGINISVGKIPKCVVLFTEGYFKKTQQIILNENGKVVEMAQGPE